MRQGIEIRSAWANRARRAGKFALVRTQTATPPWNPLPWIDWFVTATTPVLAVQDAAHGHATDSPALLQHQILAAQDGAHGHAADSPALTQHQVLAAQDAAHGHAADSPALTQHQVLAAQDAAHGHAADSPTLTYHPPSAGGKRRRRLLCGAA
jgi:hypothetical protein